MRAAQHRRADGRPLPISRWCRCRHRRVLVVEPDPAPWAVAVPRSGGAPSQPPQYGGGASSADGDGSRSAPSLRAVSPRNKFVDQSRRLSQQTTATPGAGDGTALAAPSRLSSGTAHAPELPCGLAAEIGVEKLDWAEYPDAAGSAAEYGEVPWPPPGTVTPGSSTTRAATLVARCTFE